jgi:hypothetical protein
MTQEGTEALAQYNAYLGELSAAAAAQGRKMSRKMQSIAGARGFSARE